MGPHTLSVSNATIHLGCGMPNQDGEHAWEDATALFSGSSAARTACDGGGWLGVQQDLRGDGDLRACVLLDLLEVAALLANQSPHQTVVC